MQTPVKKSFILKGFQDTFSFINFTEGFFKGEVFFYTNKLDLKTEIKIM